MQKKSKVNLFTFMMLIIIGLTFQPAISTYAACPDGIISYWKLDEANGPDYFDFFGDNDGTGSADPIAALAPAGRVNNAQAFNGTDTGIDVAADSSFNWVSSDSFSIEAWLKIDTGIPVGNNQVIVGRKDADVAFDISWFIAVQPVTGYVHFTLKDKNGSRTIGAAGNINVADGFWHHVVAVRDDSAGVAGRNLLYVDGNLQDSAGINYTAGFLSNSAEINIGWFDFSPTQQFRFEGLIDEVALYDRALDPVDDILAHYNAGLAGNDYCLGSNPPGFAPFPDNTISLWPLDEANGPDYFDFFGDNDGTGSADPIAALAPAGRVNNAQAFNGTDTGIDVAADSSFNWVSSDSFSIEAWLKIDTGIPVGNNQVIVGRKDADVAFDISWFIAVQPVTGYVHFTLKDKNGSRTIGAAGNINVADGFWHHVVAVRDDSAGVAGRNLLYVDGNLQDSAGINYTAGFLSNSAEINIGWFDFSPTQQFRFEGLIDEVALYDRALDPVDDILAHYNAGLAGNGVQSLRPAPTALADATPLNPTGGTVVTLDGTGSSIGYAGTTISYSWVETTATGVPLTVTAPGVATFPAPVAIVTLTFRLTVTASDGQSSTDDVSVNVNGGIVPSSGGGGGGGGCFITSMF